MPLRLRLVALLVVLLAVALAVTGYVATSQLRQYLVGQQQTQLQEQVRSLSERIPDTIALCNSSNRYPGPTLIACANDSTVAIVQGGGSDARSLPDVSAITPSTIQSYDDEPFTLPSGDGTTTWLLISNSLTATTVITVGIDLSDDQRILARLIIVQLVVGAVVLVLLGVAGYVLVRTSLRPLVEVEHTAAAIAGGDLSRRVPEGDERTEVGRLGRALNGMLARIEGAFQAQAASEEQARASEGRMRRFVADASHELRTPLTSIRGFAELYRQGAFRGDDAETQRMMGRIEGEAARMGALVEDLLQLARLDQHRPVAALPVDLGEVAGDAVHDARAVQPDRPVRLELAESLTDVPVVLGDEGRLRQVVANLVTNALTHTPPGTPVTVRLSEEPGDPDAVVVEVADEGPGLAPEDAARVFERFYRADASRTRDAGGSGLGLSIVSSLVAAHGGTTTLRTAPGQGATFAVRLPRSGPAGQG
ncbi:HAMP domain-containing sensor histidine kinase [Klenkia sp. LSe6-5]|uniref:histidine kinase n=1 Tax=Klenkia sesuvii TaxID=3103137 RepID=A0ABU8DN67_9ACTN